MSPQEHKAMWAALMDHFKVTPHQLGKLTDRQIHELYFHARDEHGAIKCESPPPPPPNDDPKSYEEALHRLHILAAAYRLTPSNVADLEQKLKEKWTPDSPPPSSD